MQGFDLVGCAAAAGAAVAATLTPPWCVQRDAVASCEYAACAVVSRRWKFVYNAETDRGRLFHRQNDPEENNNLWSVAAAQRVRDGFLHALLRWRSMQVPLATLRSEAISGPNVEKLANAHTHELRGTDAERWLSSAALRLDAVELRTDRP